MKILVCVKRVPMTGGRIVLTEDALAVEYMNERFPVTVAVVGATAPFDPENARIRS